MFEFRGNNLLFSLGRLGRQNAHHLLLSKKMISETGVEYRFLLAPLRVTKLVIFAKPEHNDISNQYSLQKLSKRFLILKRRIRNG